MNFPFPTLQQGMADTAFQIQAPMMQKRIDQNQLMMQDLQLQQGLAKMQQAPGSPQPEIQPGTVNFGGFRAMGGPVMPGKGYMVGERLGPTSFSSGPVPPALNDPTAGPAGMVWDATLQRWVPKRASKVMGTTNWDVKNFGKYNGLTSAGPIGMASQPGPARSGLADFYENNPDQTAMTPGMTPSMDSVKDWMSTIARRALGTPPGKVEAPNVPIIVGDKSPAVDEWADVRRANEKFWASSAANSPAPAALPEIMVSPSGAQVVGKNGTEVIVPKEPSYIIPNPANVAAARTMGDRKSVV
jgi:hypothetical protein